MPRPRRPDEQFTERSWPRAKPTFFLPTAELAVAADYGLTVLSGSSPQAYQLAMFILSVHGQHVLAKYGFAAPALSQ